MHSFGKSNKTCIPAIFTLISVLCWYSTSAAQWENRGDLNLNGIPFELADAAIYGNYFAIGLPAFTIAPELQIAATDINRDGIMLTVADYVMMIRIEMGAGDPPPVPADSSVTTMTYGFTDSSVIVAAKFGQSPAAMYLQFSSDGPTTYTPRLLQTGGPISFGYANVGRALSILIVGMENIQPGNDPVPLAELVYQGTKPTPFVAAVQGVAGELVIMETDSTFRSGDANGDEAVNIGDAVYVINFIFKGGPPSIPSEAGDSNCDKAVNIGDAVHVINFIFKGGPAPGCA